MEGLRGGGGRILEVGIGAFWERHEEGFWEGLAKGVLGVL